MNSSTGKHMDPRDLAANGEPPMRTSRLHVWVQFLLARWWVFMVLFLLTNWIFGVLVPRRIAIVTAGGAAGQKLLDEHFFTWSHQDAVQLMTSLGQAGRDAYVHFYLTFDYYFPALTCTLMLISVLLLLLKTRPRLVLLAYFPLLAYVFDFLENTTNLFICRSWPARPALLWTLGPVWTASKWFWLLLSMGLVGVAIALRLADFAGRRLRRV